MIANPFICTKGPRVGSIIWIPCSPDGKQSYDAAFEKDWKPYADFEREKLKQIARHRESASFPDISHGYHLLGYYADDLIGYTESDFSNDSESSRLLKRAEFLKAVCEKEGVEWLPNERRGFEGVNRLVDDTLERIDDRLREKPERKNILVFLLEIMDDVKTGDDALVCIGRMKQEIAHAASAEIRSQNPGNVKCPERDCYTKAEIDAKIKGLHDYSLRQNRIGDELEAIYEKRILSTYTRQEID